MELSQGSTGDYCDTEKATKHKNNIISTLLGLFGVNRGNISLMFSY